MEQFLLVAYTQNLFLKKDGASKWNILPWKVPVINSKVADKACHIYYRYIN
jgi:hypothetical protein